MLGSIISAVGSLAGGLFGANNANKQMKMQREFAQHGVRWKVADAKKAGIHPLYALGAQTTPYTPVSAGDMGLPQAGQDIGRAIDAGLSSPEKKTSYSRTMQALSVERAKVQNEILKADLQAKHAVVNQAGRPPPKPAVNDLAAKPEDTVYRFMGRDVPGLPRTSAARRVEDAQGEVAGTVVSGLHSAYGAAYHQARDLLEKGHITAHTFNHIMRNAMRNPNSGKNRDRWNRERSAYLKRRYGYHGKVY